MTTLELRGVTTGYYPGRPVLVDVSVTVSSGQIVALIGSNGAGKSTTLKAISGLLRPWSGEILLDGVELAGRQPPAILRAGIAQVPEGRRVLPELSVRENLELGGFVRDRAARRAAIEHVFELFPVLRTAADRAASSLSGGEQQMLALGRALMSGPGILLLDEPSMGLAPKLVERIVDHVETLRQEGLGILLVEQNASLALESSTHAYVLEQGRITLSGPSADLSSDTGVRATYLGV